MTKLATSQFWCYFRQSLGTSYEPDEAPLHADWDPSSLITATPYSLMSPQPLPGWVGRNSLALIDE